MLLKVLYLVKRGEKMIEDIPKDVQIQMFHTMKRKCELIIEKLEKDEMSLNGSEWKTGMEVNVGDRKYHFVLELTEVYE